MIRAAIITEACRYAFGVGPWRRMSAESRRASRAELRLAIANNLWPGDWITSARCYIDGVMREAKPRPRVDVDG